MSEDRCPLTRDREAWDGLHEVYGATIESLRTQLDKAVEALDGFVAAYRATEGGSKRGDDACSKAVATLLQIKGDREGTKA